MADVHCAYDELRPVAKLKPHPRNPNTHPPSQVRLLAKVISETGWRAPITVSLRSGYITRGHGRLLAAQQLGLDEVPVDLQEYPDDAAELADLVADNKLAELSEMDRDVVASILREAERPELAGYSPDAVDQLLAQVDVAAHKREAKEVALPKSKPEKLKEKHGTSAGQLWATPDRRHVLAIGSATDEAVWTQLQALLKLAPDHGPIDAVFTDPPYGVAYEGGTGMTIENDDLDEDALAALLDESFTHAFATLKPGGSVYVCCPGGDLHHLFIAAMRERDALRQTIIWVKDAFVLGRQDYHWRHEPILYGWKPGNRHYFAPGDRTQDTVWEIDALEQDTVWRFPRPKRSAEHPTMKPIELVAKAITNSTRPGERVLDFFAGSGSTAIAAAQLDRSSVSIELDPLYAAVIIERLAGLGVQLAPVE
ncbi:MAG TPA: site-specific DNA-methyltransferase [Agromyces sp.]